jgi:ketosteroid isomerase-like protein
MLGTCVIAPSSPCTTVWEPDFSIKTTGRIYLQDYVLFLRAAGDMIAFLREYFDPVRAAKAMDTPILGLEP